jgi:hypothetical protein
MAQRYAIWCKVTDSKNVVRQSWLKESTIVTLYPNEKSATESARALALTMARSVFHSGSKYEYEAREYDEV